MVLHSGVEMIFVRMGGNEELLRIDLWKGMSRQPFYPLLKLRIHK